MRLLTKCPQRRKQIDHKDAVLLLLKQASLMARAAPPWGGRFTLLPVFTLQYRVVEVCQQSEIGFI
ncbi:hypothetical protein DVQ92_19425 [Yersinia enterocolitica]|nr:hypothetical protein [Yersinia enterocolitica]